MAKTLANEASNAESKHGVTEMAVAMQKTLQCLCEVSCERPLQAGSHPLIGRDEGRPPSAVKTQAVPGCGARRLNATLAGPAQPAELLHLLDGNANTVPSRTPADGHLCVICLRRV
jgi:hypothetical protein